MPHRIIHAAVRQAGISALIYCGLGGCGCAAGYGGADLVEQVPGGHRVFMITNPLLPVSLAAVCDTEDQETLIRPHVDDPIVANSQAPKPPKLTSKRLHILSTATKFLFQFLEESRSFFFIDPLEVFNNGSFVLDLICQAAFSTRRER